MARSLAEDRAIEAPMLPFEIPPGTTLASLVEEVVPAAHARLVPQSAGRVPFRCAFELDGLRNGAWVIHLDGAAMRVERGEERAVDVRFRAHAEVAQAFLDDWTGPQRFVPKAPKKDIVLFSDPRLLTRVKMATGVLELALRDFPGNGGGAPRRVTLSIAVGAPAKKVEPDPDVVVETSLATYLRMLAGEIGPEDALADGDVKVTGKRLVAAQLAFAVGPFFPRGN
jgi:SCP-2 sterol transfer family